MTNLALLTSALMLWASNALSAPVVIRYFQTDLRYQYRIELLQLALQKTQSSDGDFVLKPVLTQDPMTQARGLDYLEKGHTVDVAFLPTNQAREQQFLAIRIPILQGILGYRVLMVHKDHLPLFANIHNINELTARFRAGFGTQWADLAILKENGLSVTPVVKYDGLFKMLEKQRFDYIPRGINEAWQELITFADDCPNLAIAPSIALYYPYPVYFFVNKHNTALANRIERGLNIALRDGSFRKLFLRYHQDDILRADLRHRKIFKLSNPTLAEGTAEPDTSWWLPTQ